VYNTRKVIVWQAKFTANFVCDFSENEIRLPFFSESGYNKHIFFGKKEGGTT
jgi:hypothetical protein